jgi:hypothetical protein
VSTPLILIDRRRDDRTSCLAVVHRIDPGGLDEFEDASSDLLVGRS